MIRHRDLATDVLQPALEELTAAAGEALALLQTGHPNQALDALTRDVASAQNRALAALREAAKA